MKPRKIPMRMCVGCREMKPKKELLRVVRSPEGAVSLDVTGKKPGRGAYICPDEQCFKKAVKQKQLERVLEASLEPQVLADLEKSLKSLPPRAAAAPEEQ